MLYCKGALEPALARFTEVLKTAPDSFLANYWAANAQLGLGRRDQAMSSFERATRSAPRFFAALFAAAELQFTSGHPEKAVPLYRQAQAVKPDAGLSLRLGVYYENTGDLAAAEREYRQVVQLSPSLFVGYNQLAWLFAKRGVRLEEALELAAKADALQPGNASVLDTLGWIHHQRKDYEKAIEKLSAASRSHPENPTIWYHLGAVQLARGNKEQAQKALETAVRLGGNTDAAASARQLLQGMP
jgi:tetratricopeptide (TPR) repeat protein